MSSLLNKLKQFIITQLNAASERQRLAHPTLLTIGVEHEFFLLNTNGTPADHAQSQDFLQKIANLKHWRIYKTSHDPAVGNYISRVSKESKYGFCALKYDHHPHLLEIAFPYFDNLHDLYSIISSTLADFKEVAQQLSLQLSSSSFLDGQAPESPLQDFVNLRSYRKTVLEENSKEISPDLYNYAASIAATQTHIGGSNWWNNKTLVSALYTFEPEILFINFESLNTNLSFEVFLKKRWLGYLTVFEKSPLIGYPAFDDWNIENWVSALLKSPLCGPATSSWSGRTWEILDTKPKDFSDLNYFITAVRDLQIIRPKLFGTLEFRSDAALPTAEAIIRMAAIRLGITNALVNNIKAQSSYKFGLIRWHQALHGDTSHLNVQSVLELAARGLQLRKLNEETFLSLQEPTLILRKEAL